MPQPAAAGAAIAPRRFPYDPRPPPWNTRAGALSIGLRTPIMTTRKWMKNELQRHRADEAADYSTEGSPSRRKALRLFAGLTGAALGSRLVDAQTAPAAPAPAAPPARPAGPRSAMSVKYNDPEILTANLQFPGSDAQLMGYIARPLKGGTFPIVLVCHEIEA
jgi:hypothetical protein